MKTVHPGTLIVFEGIDGAGKSTHARGLFQSLREASIRTTLVSYKTQPWFCEAFNNQPTGVDAQSELQFFAWAFNTLVRRCVRPPLMDGKVVLVDRYNLSYFAYQSFHKFDPKMMASKITAGAPVPDLMILFRVPLEIALVRRRTRQLEVMSPDTVPFDLNALARLKHVANYFQQCVSHNAVIIDENDSFEEGAKRIWNSVTRLIGI